MFVYRVFRWRVVERVCNWRPGLTIVLLAAYILLVAVLALHGAHRLWLAFQAVRHRHEVPRTVALGDVLPRVTVQLPVFNERDVAARLVDAVAALDWPADRLQIQLLDDSTDDTAASARRALDRARALGIDVQVIHRDNRVGYKAGALANGLLAATGDFIAIFDADFVPAPDFLRVMIPHFAAPDIGMVQARWEHLNAEASALTLAQSVMLDGHFVVEHTARNRSGLWFNFNGTAGVWRKEAIEAGGGWQNDTLTEDLDLSYRTQLAGWRFVYVVDHAVPAEVPATMGAFRSQQRRWAKGSVETARKLRDAIVNARVPLRVKMEALSHLHANFAWPLGLAIAVLLPALVAFEPEGGARTWLVDLPGFGLATLPNVLFYGQAIRGKGRGLWILPAMVLAIGLAPSQTRAVWDALRGQRSEFVRTPKQGAGEGSYRPERTGPPVELLFGAWQLAGAVAAIQQGAWGSLPFLLLFAAGFGWVGGLALVERRAAQTIEPALVP